MWKLKIRFLTGLFSCAALSLVIMAAPLTTPLIIQLHAAQAAESRPRPDKHWTVFTLLSKQGLTFGLFCLTTKNNGLPRQFM